MCDLQFCNSMCDNQVGVGLQYLSLFEKTRPRMYGAEVARMDTDFSSISRRFTQKYGAHSAKAADVAVIGGHSK
jgi:hypothetical protein